MAVVAWYQIPRYMVNDSNLSKALIIPKLKVGIEIIPKLTVEVKIIDLIL